MDLDLKRRRTLRPRAMSRIITWFDRLSPSPRERNAMSCSVFLVFDKLTLRDA
jgi:hypothetical protein